MANRRLRRLAVCSAWFLAGLGVSAALAQQAAPEATLKAAFVYNFAKYVEWPAEAFSSPQANVVVCLFGARDALQAALATIDGKTAQNRVIRVQRLARLEDAGTCHVLFVSASEEQHLAAPLRAVQNTSVLTVSDADGFVEAGGIIGMVVAGDRVQFEVNLEKVPKNKLKLSSQLLKLARRVKN
jgi:hypothetical protein